MLLLDRHLCSRLGFSIWLLIWVVAYPMMNASDALGGVFQSPANEPKVAAASDEGQNAISSFQVPKGWECRLFAAEPDVANPVAIFLDRLGRVYVCETFRQNNGVTDNRGHDFAWTVADVASRTVQDRIAYHQRLLPDGGKSFTQEEDRIRRLVDRDRDGQVDQVTVVANGFNRLEDGTGAGVLAYGNKIFYTCIPKLWELRDQDLDGVAEERRVIADGFGVRVALRGHDMHGLVMGPDGRLYFSIGDRGYHVQYDGKLMADPASGAVFRCEMDGSRLEVFATGLRNPQELAFDDFGRLFTGDNNSDSGDRARWVYVVEGGDTGWRMHYQYHPTRGPFNRQAIWEPYSSKTPAYVIPPVANVADGPSGLTFYPGTGLDDSFLNTFLLCDFRGQASNSGVRAIQVEEKGAFFTLSRNDQLLWNVLATDIDFGPDGNLYLCDWVNGWNGEGKGRIYRFHDPRFQKENEAVRLLLSTDFTKYEDATLQQFLQHRDRRVRYEAQWTLADRQAVQLLKGTASDSSLDVRHRLHGVWGLGQIARGKRDQHQAALEQLDALLNDSNDRVVALAIQMMAEAGSHMADSKLTALVRSPSVHVQVAAAMAIGKLQVAEGLEAVCELLKRNDDADPILRHAGIMGLAGQPDLLQVVALKSHPIASVRRGAVVALRKRLHDGIVEFLNDIDPKVAAEAANAIHDVLEYQPWMPQLAASLERSGAELEWTRRALNAHFRLGLAANAEAVARFAGESQQPEELRLEALRMLKDWSEPPELDRLTSDYRPLPKRDPSIPKNALRLHIASVASGSNEVRTLGFEIAAQLSIGEVAPLLTRVLKDRNAPGNQRASALSGLHLIDPESAAELAVLYTKDPSSELKIASLRLLVQRDPSGSLDALKQLTQSSISLERQAAWDMIATLPDAVGNDLLRQGATAYLQQALPEDVRLNVYEAVVQRKPTALPEAWQAMVASRASPTEGPSIDAYLDCMEGGSMLNGKELFFQRSQLSCVRCHRVGDKGGEVGPKLTDIGNKKDARYLLESIVAPNAQIAEGFDSIVIATEDGEVVTGILKKESPDSIQLIKADGEIVSIDVDAIAARRKGISSMPADLVKMLTLRELRDLVAYLKALDGKNPAVIPSAGH